MVEENMRSLQQHQWLKFYRGWYLLVLLLIFPATSPHAKPNISGLEQGVVRILTMGPNDKVVTGSGTGFLINNDGVIVTNWHVVDGAAKVGVVFAGETETNLTKAVLLKKLPELDLAFIKVAPPNKKPVKLSSAPFNKGDSVMVIGFPGLADGHDVQHSALFEASITRGAISRVFFGSWPGTQRTLEKIQHDSAVNPGNSGGPLFDECGRVIGVNTQASGSSRIERNDKGQVIDVMAGIGVNVSSHISETIRELKNLGIQFEEESETCDPNSWVAEQAAVTNTMVKWMAVLGVVTLAALALALRKPRERIIEVIKETSERASSLVSRSGGSTQGLRLSGTDSMGGGIRINIRSDQLTSGYGFSLGRHPELVDKAIDDEALSKRHCRFSWSDNYYFVEDLNSSNGTFVNGQRLEPFKKIKIRTGDSLQLGSVNLNIQ